MRWAAEMDAGPGVCASPTESILGSRSMPCLIGRPESLLPCADMGQSLISRVQGAIEKQGLLRAGERVGVAVSGGADSVALLLLLLELRRKLGIVLSVVHFNHKLRGKASEADEAFVKKLALQHGLAFHGGQADVKGEAGAL